MDVIPRRRRRNATAPGSEKDMQAPSAAMSQALACAVFAIALAAAPLWAKEEPAEKTILNHMTFWRQHYTLDGAVMRRGEELEKIKLISGGKEVAKWLGVETTMPPQDWRQTGFDDSGWLRKPVSEPNSPWLKLLCLRGRFHVTDPEKAAGLSLLIRYRGGVAVYLNGKEVARGHLKAGATPADLAEDYLAPDFMQVRELSAIPFPKSVLRKGLNVLAIEVHRSPARIRGENGGQEHRLRQWHLRSGGREADGSVRRRGCVQRDPAGGTPGLEQPSVGHRLRGRLRRPERAA